MYVSDEYKSKYRMIIFFNACTNSNKNKKGKLLSEKKVDKISK